MKQYIDEAIEACENGYAQMGLPEDQRVINEGQGTVRHVYALEDDMVLRCDLQIYEEWDIDLNGHSLRVEDGHKIFVHDNLRVYGGTSDSLTIETNGGADLVFGSAQHNNLKVYAGTSYEEALSLDDKNEVYLQNGYYNDSTFFISQNASMDIDGASFVTTSNNVDNASIIVQLDDRNDAGADVDALLKIESGYFESTARDCDKSSIMLEAPDMLNNNAHIIASIEYARFEGQNAIMTQMGASRTGDSLELLDGEGELDGSYILSYGNDSDPDLSIKNGEYMTKAGFYGNDEICQNVSGLRASSIESGIFSDSTNITPSSGMTLLPLRDRDFDNDGKNDVVISAGINTATETVELTEGEEVDLVLKNLAGEDVLVDSIEWTGANDYAEANGLRIIAKKAGETELTLRYGTQEKKYSIIIKEREPGTNVNPSEDDSGNSKQQDGDKTEPNTPLTIDTIKYNIGLFSSTTLAVVAILLVIKRYTSRSRIEK